MLTFYCWILFLLLISLAWLAYPFIQTKQVFSKAYGSLALGFTLLALLLFQFSINTTDLHLWLSEGQQRFQLLSKFNALGGVDGAIQRINEKLTRDPSDIAGWLILNKLYESKGDNTNAANALNKAHQLQSDNAQNH